MVSKSPQLSFNGTQTKRQYIHKGRFGLISQTVPALRLLWLLKSFARKRILRVVYVRYLRGANRADYQERHVGDVIMELFMHFKNKL